MKNILFILSTVFLAVGCGGNEPGFESHSDALPSVATSRGSEDGGRISTRRVQVDVTVGVDTRKIRKGSGKGSEEHARKSDESKGTDDIKTNVCSPPCVSQEAEPKELEEVASSDPQVDILFYLGHKGDGACWNWLGHSIKKTGFASHINGLDWQMSMAFVSNNPELYLFRSDYLGGTGSYLTPKKIKGKWFFIFDSVIPVLKKEDITDDRKTDKVVGTTIETEYIRYVGSSRNDPRDYVDLASGNPVFLDSKPPTNPLGGLDQLLKKKPGFVRKGSQVFIVFVDFDRYYYDIDSDDDKTIDWRGFLEGREHVNLIFLSSRRQNANLIDVTTGEEFGFEWISCSNSNIAGALAKSISSQSGMVD